MEGQAQQALLAPGLDVAGDVQERGPHQLAALEDPDGAALLHDVEPVGLPGGVRDADRVAEAGLHAREPEARRGGGGVVGGGRLGRGLAGRAGDARARGPRSARASRATGCASGGSPRGG